MNKSDIFTRLKLKLGLMAFSLPFMDIDETITWILDTITTPTYSIYFPYKENMLINVSQLELVEKTNMYRTYLLPEMKVRKLLYVMDIKYNDRTLTGFGYYDGMLPVPDIDIINSLMLANSQRQLANLITPTLTFELEPPRKIRLYGGYYTSEYIFELGFQQDLSLASISDDETEEYFKLALLDVKENLYPTLKYYNEINTAHGNISLKIDDWAEAESARAEMIEKYEDQLHLERWKPVYYG